MDNDITEKVKAFVSKTFQENYDKRSTYHSFEHTRQVAEAAEKIGKGSDLREDELEIVIVSAWLHDTGYLFEPGNHEAKSAGIAEEFLKANNYAEEKIKKVADCIMATRMNHIPVNLMEEVIRDADFINLASSDNLKQAEFLKMEAVNYGGAEPSEEEWLNTELKFLLNHRYYTAYGRKKLEEKKEDNIKKLKKKLKKLREGQASTESQPMKKEEKEKSKSETENDKIKLEEQKMVDKKEATNIKGFEAIYKLTATNHMRLNAIADRKANIMLTLNGIIISITLSIVASDSDSNARLLIPTGILIVVCLATIIFATLSTRPKVTTGTIAKEDIENKKANLLFFGNFSKMEYEDFDFGMRKIMTDQEYLHNSMIQDFYNLGKVLDLKFKYLRICYNVFMFGIIVAVLSVVILVMMGY